MKGKETKKEKKKEKKDTSLVKVQSDYQKEKNTKSIATPLAIKPKK